MILLNFGNYKIARKILIENEIIQFFEEEPYSASATEKDGLYEVLNGELIAVFSKNKKNYLYLNGQLFLLTPEISIEYFIAQDMHTRSWFKLFKSEDLIFNINYLNPHKPFVLSDPFFSDEDYETTNFASHLAQWISKIKKENNVVLFHKP